MSEGENKFLKLAWNTSQEKPSVSQIVMKQTLEQSVIAGEGEAGSPAWSYLPRGGTAAAQPGTTFHRVGQQQPSLVLPTMGWDSSLHIGESHPLGNTHCHHPTGMPAPQECCVAATSAVTEG